ncbi:hypothetical protein ACKWTF_007188 [Chironomus riparius]
MENFRKSVSKNFQNFLKFFKLRRQPVVIYYSFQDFFFCEKLLNVLGHTFLLNPKHPPNRLTKINGVLNQVTNFILLVLLLISIFQSIRGGFVYVVLENILVLGSFTTSLFKVYMVFHKNLGKIFEVIEKLNEHFPHSHADQFVYNVSSNFHVLHKMYIIYNIAYYTLIPQFCSMPFVFQIYAAYKSIDLEWETILAFNLGFNQLRPVVFELIYIVEAWFIIFSVYYILGSDLLYANMVQILSMEFEILGQMIKDIDFNNNEEKVLMDHKRLVNIHQELIEVSEKLNEIFSPLILINAFASIAGLCSTSFLSVVTKF